MENLPQKSPLGKPHKTAKSIPAKPTTIQFCATCGWEMGCYLAKDRWQCRCNRCCYRERKERNPNYRKEVRARAKQRNPDYRKAETAKRLARNPNYYKELNATHPRKPRHGRASPKPGTYRRRVVTMHRLTEEEYKTMLENQGGVCAVCKQPDNRKHHKSGTSMSLAVDHNHTSGEVRGLLCMRCNVGVGYFNDDPDLLRAMADYIQR